MVEFLTVAKFLTTSILKSSCEWLLLNFWKVFSKNLFRANFLHPYQSDQLYLGHSKGNFWWNKNWNQRVRKVKPKIHKEKTTAIEKTFMQNHIKSRKHYFCTPVSKFQKISTLNICGGAWFIKSAACNFGLLHFLKQLGFCSFVHL